jgi:2-polyprenyl-3-methyl-5-hydroxy-6-metoxy-1,4-benzoquinol methylase
MTQDNRNLPRARRHGQGITVTVQATQPPRRPVRAFDRWVAQSIQPGSTVLNIGAGADRSGHLPRIRARAGRLVGIDPSERIQDNATVDERHQLTLEQFAPSHQSEFDLAFSVFVLEHVADPPGFTAACSTVLRPGGVLMGMTVNRWHYFGLSTWAATRLGISEWLLSKVRSTDQIAAYHFPTEYRMNTIRSVTRLLDDAGFRTVEFRMWDLPSMYTPYLPARLDWLAAVWQRLTYQFDRPNLMGHLTFKAEK